MRKEYNISHSSNDQKYIFKVFSIKSNYLKYLRKGELQVIANLEGKAINDIPFVNSYLKQCVCRIEKVSIEDKAVQYKLDFQKEKIVHENNMPLRIIYHEKVEVIHYYKSNMAVIFNDNAFNKDALYIIMVLAYWSILRNNQRNDIHYSKPVINEIDINFSKDFEVFRSFLFQYIECDNDNGGSNIFRLNENFWERDKKRAIYELRLFRKNHIKYYYMNNGGKQSILIKANGEVESTIPLNIDILERFVGIFEFLSFNNKQLELPDNIDNYLEQWIDLLSKDMEPEYKVKKKLNVISDLKDLLREALKYNTENIEMDILQLSIYMKLLISLCINRKESTLGTVYIDCIEYDTLCDFLRRFVREKYCINLSELELNNVLNRFYVELREGKEDLLTSLIRYDTLENNKL